MMLGLAPQEYHLVFDSLAQGYIAWQPAIVPVAFALAAFWVAAGYRRASRGTRERGYRVVALVAGGVAIVFSLAIVLSTLRQYWHIRDAMNRGTYVVLEGPVTDFVPGGPGGHPVERFKIGAAQFAYGSSDISSAFHKTVWKGGPIREKLQIRVAVVDGQITRLEVRDRE